ncbi:sodium:calcium antiporter [Erythrobacter sp. KY5]|uniref:calcium/sodium antiporter n=1 Tax=Erythrobacter sp. KY5 TaxID=2011159 RepID=UPI000DBF0B70|nr:calcium/sodium antiporter [Erythrobacter sp. KY5]AWW74042.1 sodium:calcium antiporter [Erythrobacter sp. KY5]
MTYLVVLGGLVLLAIGGDLLVRGAVGLSTKLGVSPLLAGLTIVGFGTSTPELVTSLQAALQGSPGIAIGNVVGSNIANVLLILGVSAVILPLAIEPRAFRRDGLALITATLACVIAVLIGELTRPIGIALLAGMVGYVLYAYFGERRAATVEGEVHVLKAQDAGPATRFGFVMLSAFVIAGLAAAILGANLLVQGSVELARSFAISEAVIGVSVVALGTSLPELIACVVAALRKHGDVALGNVIGSNIYNVFGILGITAIVEPLDVPAEIIRLDIWVFAAATMLLLAFLRSGWRISRIEGATFIAAYAGYCAVIFS